MDSPDLSRVTDRQLDHFIGVRLFGLAGVAPRPCTADPSCGGLEADGDHSHEFFDDDFLAEMEPGPRGETDLTYILHPGEPYPYEVVPHYSTDPAGALRVVEAMGEKAWYHESRTYCGLPPAYRHESRFVSYDPERGSASAKAGAFPRAVCEAAVAALWRESPAESRAILSPNPSPHEDA